MTEFSMKRLFFAFLPLLFLGSVIGPFQVDPDNIDFGTVVNTHAKFTSIHLKLNQLVELPVDAFFQLEASPTNPFLISETQARLSNGVLGKPDFTLRVTLKSGTKAGTYSSAVLIQKIANNTKTTIGRVPLSAKVVEGLLLNPSDLNFGTLSSGVSKTLQIQLVPGITGPFTVNSDLNEISITPTSGTLSAGTQTSLSVKFLAGTTGGTRNGTLTIRAVVPPTDVVSRTVSLTSAVVVNPGPSSGSAPNISFGGPVTHRIKSTVDGLKTVEVTVIMKNSGNAGAIANWGNKIFLDNVVVQSFVGQALVAGEQVTRIVTFTTTKTGSAKLKVVLDVGGGLSELVETDNTNEQSIIL